MEHQFRQQPDQPVPSTGLHQTALLEPRLLMACSPTAQEEQLLFLTNALRADPAAMLTAMLDVSVEPPRSSDGDIDAGVRFFNVDGQVLKQQWDQLVPAGPLAFNETLCDAAKLHNQQMVAADEQSHLVTGEPALGQRVTNAGYTFSATAENIFAFAKSPFEAFAVLAIDWGQTVSGIQQPPGHRINIMNHLYREAGFRITPEANQATGVGLLVVIQEFGNRSDFGPARLVGNVYSDANANGRFDAGEQLAGLTVAVTSTTSGTVLTTSVRDTGGYDLALAPDTYRVRVYGSGLNGTIRADNVTVASSNVWLPLTGQQASGPNWEQLATGDIDGDGDSDVVLRHTVSGVVGAWIFQLGALERWQPIGKAPPAQWDVAGLGDVDGDGDADIVLRHKVSGLVGSWLLNFGALDRWQGIGSASPSGP